MDVRVDTLAGARVEIGLAPRANRAQSSLRSFERDGLDLRIKSDGTSSVILLIAHLEVLLVTRLHLSGILLYSCPTIRY